MRGSLALRRGMSEKRISPRLTASRRWRGSSWRGTDGMRMDDRTPRRGSRLRLRRESVTVIQLRGYCQEDWRWKKSGDFAQSAPALQSSRALRWGRNGLT